MTKRVLGAAIAAALLVVGLLPGLASADTVRVGNLDQNAAQQAVWLDIDSVTSVTQSFTAGATGRLSYFSVYCVANSATDFVWVSWDSTTFGNQLCGPTPGWVLVPLNVPPSVQSGTQYTVTITGHANPDSGMRLAASASDYTGGCLSSNGTCRLDVSDIAFRTYVQPSPTITYTWNPAHLDAGTSTPITLTIVGNFPGFPLPDGGPDVTNQMGEITLDSYPSWFTPATIACSPAVDPSPCGLANSWLIDLTGSALTVTITITGTATIPNPPGGQTATASGSGCIGYAYPVTPFIDCATGHADLTIAGVSATPPVSTRAESTDAAPADQSLWLIAGVACTALASMVVLAIGRRRSGRAQI
jgi:hypothetical protein